MVLKEVNEKLELADKEAVDAELQVGALQVESTVEIIRL